MSELPPELQNVLDDSETIEWQSSPLLKAKVAGAGQIVGMWFLLMAMSVLPVVALSVNPVSGVIAALVCTIPAALYYPIEYLKTDFYFVVTDSRVISFSNGLLDSELEYINWEDVNSVDASRELLEKLIGVGSIEVEGYKVDDIFFWGIQNPYDALNKIESVKN